VSPVAPTISYAWKDLALVPGVPGLYAWYFVPRLRPADLADLSATQRNLNSVIDHLRLPGLAVSAGGHLSLRFEGHMDHQIRVSKGDGTFTDLVDKVLDDESCRRLFAQLLEGAAPTLMAPLYVGVAVDLCDRVEQHRTLLQQYTELLVKRPEARADPGGPHSFAREVAARGIPLNQLLVQVCEIPKFANVATTLEEQRRVAEAVETILNRMFYPVFGRR
jgi:hypothetical protein